MKGRVLVIIVGILLIGANLYAANGDLIVYNKLGVGNTAPTYKLDVSGDVRFTGTLVGGSVPWARLNTFPTACTSGQYVSGIGSTLTCSTPAGGGGGLSGTGSTNYMSKWTGTTSLGNSLMYDNGTNVGIGTTSPAEKLQINSGNIKIGTADKGIVFYGGGEKIIGTAGYGIDFQTNAGTSRMTIANNGNVGFGTSSPPYTFSINLSANQHIYFNQSAASNQAQLIFADRGTIKWGMGKQTDNGFFLYDSAAAKTAFWAGGGNVGLVANGGYVGIGPITPTYQLHLATDSAAKPSTNTWIVPSDARLKTDIKSYSKGLKEILQINPVTYKYNGKGGIGHNKSISKDPATGESTEIETIDTELLTKINVGVLAQDIQSIVPEAVSSHKGKINKDDAEETDLLDFNSHSLTFILINAVKELKAEIDSLQAQIADLKAQIK